MRVSIVIVYINSLGSSKHRGQVRFNKASNPGTFKTNISPQRYVEIRVEELQNKIRSKDDLYIVLHDFRKCVLNTSIVGFNLPDKHNCPIRFMKDILCGHKKVSNHHLMI